MSEPTQKHSITTPRDIAEAARPAATPPAVRRLERDNLDELITLAEAEHGPITPEEIHERRDLLRRTRDEQQASDTNN
ncbi:CopG family transcriptional regulator [Kitasatospora sp. NPDC004614]|uniref:CopG family transcriptional regulator n=1 Tax=unclassified Kitasatospora TaxID=2633591 RepID=UPI0036836C87